jgi:SAM-dependent methyltransferase
MDPVKYDAWYRTRKGAWISDCETRLLLSLLRPKPGMSLLDAGSGTGHFTRRFREAGLQVSGLEPDPEMLNFARHVHSDIPFVQGDVMALPFRERSFDFVTAITSLCFVPEPEIALRQMWRAARRGVLLGLLNRRSLLFRRKAGRGGYAGARWDDLATIRKWEAELDLGAAVRRLGTAVFFPGGSLLARKVEVCIPAAIPWGAFLAVYWGIN